MKIEIQMQRELIKAVRKGGGRAKKTDGAHSSGWPDLVVAYPHDNLCFMECKRFTKWNTNRTRTLTLRESQTGFLNAWGRNLAWVLMGVFAEIDGRQWFTAYRPEFPEQGILHTGRFTLDRNDVREHGTPFVTARTADADAIREMILHPVDLEMEGSDD